MLGLSRRQSEILSFIHEFIKRESHSPSFREIQKAFRLKSVSTVSSHIKILKRKGFIQSEERCRRSLQPLNLEKENRQNEVRKVSEFHEAPSYTSFVSLPFIGHISFDSPIETLIDPPIMLIPDYLVQTKENSYVLKVKGDSLNSELIGHGDLLIVEAKPNAFDGETVVATLEERKSVIRRYYATEEEVRLVSVSDAPPLVLPLKAVLIQGVVTAVLRIFI